MSTSGNAITKMGNKVICIVMSFLLVWFMSPAMVLAQEGVGADPYAYGTTDGDDAGKGGSKSGQSTSGGSGSSSDNASGNGGSGNGASNAGSGDNASGASGNGGSSASGGSDDSKGSGNADNSGNSGSSNGSGNSGSDSNAQGSAGSNDSSSSSNNGNGSAGSDAADPNADPANDADPSADALDAEEDGADAMADLTLAERIDALPAASELSRGQEPYRTEILAIYGEIYSSSTCPSNYATLIAAAEKVLTVSERVDALPSSASGLSQGREPYSSEIRSIYAQINEGTPSSYVSEVEKLITLGKTVLTLRQRMEVLPAPDKLSHGQEPYRTEIFEIYEQVIATPKWYNEEDLTYDQVSLVKGSKKYLRWATAAVFSVEDVPDASTLSRGQEPYHTIAMALLDAYKIADYGSDGTVYARIPDLRNLWASAAVLLTPLERFRTDPADSNAPRWKYWEENNPTLAAAYQQELMDQFRLIHTLPLSERPSSGNDYTRMRNGIDHRFTIVERLSSVIPTAEQVANMTDAECLWYEKAIIGYPEVSKTWTWVQEYNAWDYYDQMDLSGLRALSARVLTLQQRVNALPSLNCWSVLEDPGEDAAKAAKYEELKGYIREDVKYLYGKVFGKVALASGETLPTDTSYLSMAANHVLTLDDRIACLPTVEEYHNAVAAQQNATHTELLSLYKQINKMKATAAHPDMTAMHNLRTEILTIQERMDVLPPRNKVLRMTNQDDLNAITQEICYLYGVMYEDAANGTFYDKDRLHETAEASIGVPGFVQGLIDLLPGTDALESGTEVYAKWMSQEVLFMRELVDNLDEEALAQLDATKLEDLEAWFRGEVPTIVVTCEEELKAVIAQMNTGKATTKTVIMGADFEAAGMTLNQGTLTILGDNHTLTWRIGDGLLAVDGAAVNLGSPDGTDVLNIKATSGECHSNCISSYGDGRVRVYAGTTISSMTSGAVIFADDNSVVTLKGGVIDGVKLCTSPSAIVQGAGAAKINFKSGEIKNCTGPAMGSGSGGLGAITVRDVTFNMSGGTISNCSSGSYVGGGALWIDTTSSSLVTFNMSGGTIIGCTSASSKSSPYDGGGAMYLSYGAEVNMTGGTITQCHNGTNNNGGGAVFAMYDAVFNMEGGTISDCYSAAGFGGGAVCTLDGIFNMNGGTITDCQAVAGGLGGAVLGISSASQINLNGGTITGCKGVKGGAVNINGGLCTIGSGMEISGNQATSTSAACYGGGVYYSSSAGTLVIEKGARIVDNSVVPGAGKTGSAGAIYTSKPTVIKGAEISGNTAPSQAGAIYASGTLTISGDTVIDGNSASQGGAIFAAAPVTLGEGVKVSNNSAALGGGLLLNSASGQSVVKKGAVITGNSASSQAGGLYLNKGATIIEDGADVYGNSADGCADDILAASSSAVVSLGSVDKSNKLDCGHKINGWYYDADAEDGDGNPVYYRWSGDLTEEQYEEQLVEPNAYAGMLPLKAAHGVVQLISFDLGYEGAPAMAPVEVSRGTTLDKPDDPERNGFKFLDWYVEAVDSNGDPTGEFVKFDFDTEIEADMTLLAKWGHRVNFTTDKESWSVDVFEGDVIAEPDFDDRNRDGYEFQGWFEEGATEAYEFGGVLDKNLDLTAKWAAIYTVTLDNDGTLVEVPVVCGNTMEAPEMPKKDGYAFLGWFEEGATEAFDFENTPIEGDLHLTTAWTVVGNLSYEVNYLEEAVDGAGNHAVLAEPKVVTDQAYLTEVTEKAVKIDGYVAKPSSITFEVGVEKGKYTERNVINFYYAKRADLGYTVTYVEKGTGENGADKALADPKVVADQVYLSEVTESAIDIDGYVAVDPSSVTFKVGVEGEGAQAAFVENNQIAFAYAKRNDLEYTVKFYKDSVAEGNYIAGADAVVDGVTFATALADLGVNATIASGKCPEGYVAAGVVDEDSSMTAVSTNAEANVVNVVLSKRADLSYTVKFYKDAVDAANYVEDADATVTGVTFATSLAGLGVDATIDAGKCPAGYVASGSIDYDSSLEAIGVDADANIVNVVLSKRGDMKYTVKFYKDAVDAANYVEGADAVADDAVFKTAIENLGVNTTIAEGKCPVGYRQHGTVDEDSSIQEIGADEDANIVNVVLVKRRDLSYTVKFYKDSVAPENYVSGADAVVDNAIFATHIDELTVNTTIAEGKCPVGYRQHGAIDFDSSLESIGVDADSNIVNVVLVKRRDLSYTVRFYIDSVDAANYVEGADATVNNAVFATSIDDLSVETTISSDKCPVGYRQHGAIDFDSSLEIIDVDATKNVVNVVLVKRRDLQYTVKFYKDAVADSNYIQGADATVNGAIFATHIDQLSVETTIDEDRCPVGYRQHGTIDFDSSLQSIGVDADSNVVNVVLVKRRDLSYTVKFYKDSVDAANYIEGADATVTGAIFATSIRDLTVETSIASDKCPVGYRQHGTIDFDSSLESIGVDAASNIVNVVLVKRRDLSYTVKFYTDSVTEENHVVGADAVVAGAIFATSIRDLTVNTSIAEDKCPVGYRQHGSIDFDSSLQAIGVDAAENVVNVVLVKRRDLSYTVKFYIDSVDAANYVEGADATVNGAIFATSIRDLTVNTAIDAGKCPEGYVSSGSIDLDSSLESIGVDAEANIVNVVLSKRGNISYTVKFYKDSVDESNYVEGADAVASDAVFKTSIENLGVNTSIAEDKCPVGYRQHGSVDFGSSVAAITADPAKNVVNVVLSKRTDLAYTVKFYKDAVDASNYISGADAVVNNAIFATSVDDLAVNIAIAQGKCPEGYQQTGSIDFNSSLESIGVDADANVVNVVLSKRSDLIYSVRFYKDSVDAGNLISAAEQTVFGVTYGTSIDDLAVETSIDEGLCPEGYYQHGSIDFDSSVQSIGVDPVKNVVNVVLVKRTDLAYTVKFYKDSVDEANHIDGADVVVSDNTFATSLADLNVNAVIDQAKCPEGYVAEGAVDAGSSVQAIGVDADSNIVNVVLVKRADLSYTVRFYKDSVDEANHIDGADVVVSDNVFAASLADLGVNTAIDAAKCPEGYVAAGTVDFDSSVQAIGVDEAANIVNVVLVKRADLSYTVKFYVDSVAAANYVEGADAAVAGAVFGTSIRDLGVNAVIDQAKCPEGYVAAGTVDFDSSVQAIGVDEAANIVNVVLVKRTDLSYTVRFYKDAVDEANRIDGADVVVENAMFATGIDDLNANTTISEDLCPEGYEASGSIDFGSSVASIGVDVDANVVNVVLAKRHDLYYTVRFYTDFVDSSNYLEDAAATARGAVFGTSIDDLTVNTTIAADKCPEGYRQHGTIDFDSSLKTIGVNGSKNIVNVVLVKRRDLSYTVKFYKDSVDEANYIQDADATVSNAIYGTPVANLGIQTTIESGLAPDGYQTSGFIDFDSSIESIGVDEAANIVNVVLVKRGDIGYTVKFYKDSVDEANYIQGADAIADDAEFGTSIYNLGVNTTIAEDKCPEGYRQHGAIDFDSSVASIGVDEAANIVNVVLVKRKDLSYTVKFYKDSVDEANYIQDADASRTGVVFGTSIRDLAVNTSIDEAKCPEGYRQTGSIDFEGSVQAIGVDESSNIVNVVLSRRSDLVYIVRFYTDSVSPENRVVGADTVSVDAVFGTSIRDLGVQTTIASNKCPEGYQPSGSIDFESSMEAIGIAARTNVVNVVLSRRTDLGYTVSYLDAETGQPIADDKVVSSVIYRTEVTELAPDIEGYAKLDPTSITFVVGVESDGTAEAFTENNSISFQYAKLIEVTLSDGVGGDETVSVVKGDVLPQPADPVRDGFVFMGWYQDGADDPYDFSTPVTEPIALTAKWGHSVTFVDGEDVTTVNVEEGLLADEPVPASRDGYKFLGWYQDGADEAYDFTQPVEENLILTTKWSKQLTKASIVPQDITCYMGGDSMSGNDSPSLRWAITLPEGVQLEDVNFQLHQDGQADIPVVFTELGDDTYDCLVLEEGVENIAGTSTEGHYIVLHRVNSGDATTKAYEVRLNDPDTWYITAESLDRSVWFEVEVVPGAVVVVRPLADQSGPITNVVPEEGMVNTDNGRAWALIPEDATFYTNGEGSGLGLLGGYENIALLFDDTLAINSQLTAPVIEEIMMEHANTCVHVQDFEGWNHLFKYMDLVNVMDGNAWVSCDTDITVFWPYPEGITYENASDYEFVVLHYRNMEREYGLDYVNVDNFDDAVMHPAGTPLVVEKLDFQLTEKGIMFVLPADTSGANMSPFALLWREKGSDNPDDPNKPDKPDKPDKPHKPSKPGKHNGSQSSNSGVLAQTGDDGFMEMGAAFAIAITSAGLALLVRRRRRDQ